VRRAPPNGPGTGPRRTPFCAKFLRSAKGAARTAKRTRNWPAPRSVLREFLRSATTTSPARSKIATDNILSRRARLYH
jgi:hypothetical protein